MQIDQKFKNNMMKKSYNEDDEYLTNPENNRLTVYPIKAPLIWESYKIQEASFWTAEEVDLSKDKEHFNLLSENEQHFIKMVLAFFSSSDTIVNINIGDRFIKDVKIREAIIAYNYQMMMENIHSEMYSLQIDNIVRDVEEKNKLFDALLHFPCIAKKAEWQMNWIESNKPFAYRLIAFAIVEGVFFSGSFCSIFWLKQRNVMPGLCASNELIARDEGMHTNFAILLYSMIKHRVPEKDIVLMFKEAVQIETEFICESLPCALLGINQDSMTCYIQFVADRLLVELGYNKIWNVKNPFDFMEKISMEGKTNFFESRPTQYQKSSVMNKTRDESFKMLDDF
jgi:ribonucleotide reductase beta subunit family protein with ferritin-like domain